MMLRLARELIQRLSAWLNDREDERLEQLAAHDYKNVTSAAAQSGETPYQWDRRRQNR